MGTLYSNRKVLFYYSKIFYEKERNVFVYKVEKALLSRGDGYEPRYIITKNGECLNEVNLWIDINSVESYLTGKKYAYVLLVYFRYLESLNLTYEQVTKKSIIEGFIRYLLYGDNIQTSISGKTTIALVKNYIGIIKNFYFWLEDELIVETNPLLNNRTSSNYSHIKNKFIYGQIYEFNTEESIIKKLRGNERKTYLRWLSKEEIEKIASSFTSDRDKCIFLISHKTGARIGEILGLKLDEYNREEKVLKIRNCKTNDNEVLVKTLERDLYIDDELAQLIDNYIINERQECENALESGYSEYLFLTSKGKNKGKPVRYHAILKAFKKAGEKAGFSSSDIITHSGRSTRAQRLLELSVEYPEIGISEGFIKDELGWKSYDTIKHYQKALNSRLRKKVASKINEVEQELSKEERKEMMDKIWNIGSDKNE